MDFLVIKFTLVITLLFTAVSYQKQPIISVNKLLTGTPFSVTCDASRVDSLKANATFIRAVQITKQLKHGVNFTLAKYSTQSVNSGNKWYMQFSIYKFEKGRNTFTGDNNGNNNINTTRIVMTSSYAMCWDTGTYDCTIKYYTTSQTEFSRTSSAHLTVASNDVYGVALTTNSINVLKGISYYKVGDNITLTCTAKGSQNKSIHWETSYRKDNSTPFYEVVPQTKFKTHSKIIREGVELCTLYEHVSTFSYIAKESHETKQYICAANNAVLAKRANITIVVRK